MNTQPHIGELSPDVSEPFPGRRFCISREVEREIDDWGLTWRGVQTQYLHHDGRWHPCCWMEDTETHGYYTQQEAEEMLRSLTGNGDIT